MNKKELRKVTYSLGSKPYQGYFHEWIIKKEPENGSEYAMALIEDAITGTVLEIESGNLIFQK